MSKSLSKSDLAAAVAEGPSTTKAAAATTIDALLAVTAGIAPALLRDPDREVVVRRPHAHLFLRLSKWDPLLVDHESVGALTQRRAVAEHVLHVGRLPHEGSHGVLDVRVSACSCLDFDPIN